MESKNRILPLPLVTFHLPLFIVMDHFCPSYFALLGPLDRAKLSEQVIPENFSRTLKILSGKGIRYLLAGNMALTLHGVSRMSADLDLLVDPMEENLRRFFETLESENFNADEGTDFSQLQGEGRKTSFNCLRLSDNSGSQFRILFNTPVTFDQAFDRRTSIPSGSLMIEVLSLEDLILMKSGIDD